MGELEVTGPVDGVLTMTLNRPPHNLWTIGLCQQLTAVLVAPPEGAHVLRLRAGGDVFCLGREREGTSAGELRLESEVLVGVQRALRATRLVTVAEVQGDAAGFGVGIVAACDVSVAAADAEFYFPEVEIGLAPALVLAWLPRVVGERQAFWLTATGERLSAAKATELGLLNAVASSRSVLAEVVDGRIAQLRRRSPRVHAAIRDMLRTFAPLSDSDALEASIDRLVVGAMRRGEP